MPHEIPSRLSVETPTASSPAHKAHHAPPSEVGHWVRTAGILSPLVIGELVKDPAKQWRFIRITSVAVALISEGLHVHRLNRERKERELERLR
jgi:hypothetical protein